MTDAETRAQLLSSIYGLEATQAISTRLESMLGDHAAGGGGALWDEHDVWLITLAMPGIAAVSAQSLVGGANDPEGAARTGMNRTLNRRRFDVDALERELDRAGSRDQRVWSALSGAIEARKRHPAFHPDAAMRVMDLPEGLVGIERETGSGEAARCVVNFGTDEALIDGEGWVKADGSPIDPRLASLDVSWSHRA